MKLFNNKEIKNENSTYVFIDASNLWQAQKVKGKMFDYEKIHPKFNQRFKIIIFSTLSVYF